MPKTWRTETDISGRPAPLRAVSSVMVDESLFCRVACGSPKRGLEGERGAANFAGWSAVTPISTFIENIIGIKIYAQDNEIHWDINHYSEHGINNLKWGKDWMNHVSMVVQERQVNDTSVIINISSSADFVLSIKTPGFNKRINIKKGSNQLVTISRNNMATSGGEIIPVTGILLLTRLVMPQRHS